MNETSDSFGLFVRNRDAPGSNPLFSQDHYWWDRETQRAVPHHAKGARPALAGRYTLDDGTPVAPSFALLREQASKCTPE
jgi:hypothetical protein